MMPKDKVIISLQTAQAELDKALEQLARMPAYDASRVRFVNLPISSADMSSPRPDPGPPGASEKGANHG
jgi:hypothetical protein